MRKSDKSFLQKLVKFGMFFPRQPQLHTTVINYAATDDKWLHGPTFQLRRVPCFLAFGSNSYKNVWNVKKYGALWRHQPTQPKNPNSTQLPNTFPINFGQSEVSYLHIF